MRVTLATIDLFPLFCSRRNGGLTLFELGMQDPKLGGIMDSQGPDGIVPKIFSHYTALPHVYDFEHAVEEKLSDQIKRQYLMGAQTMLVKWSFKKGAVIPLHFHSNEQVSWIIRGSVQVKSQGKTFFVKEGGVIVFPAYVPHEFIALEETVNIDFFSPVRDDWLTNSADDLKPIQK